MHWRSLTAPELNLYRCHSLTEQFYRDWRQRRPYIINNYESQAVLSLREFYTIPEMRILRLDSEWANIERQRRIKINGYVNFLLYNKHQHLSSGPSPREPVLATRRAHVSRIQFMPSHESQ